jgi:hypothetical protein
MYEADGYEPVILNAVPEHLEPRGLGLGRDGFAYDAGTVRLRRTVVASREHGVEP